MQRLYALEVRIQSEENQRNKEIDNIKKYIFQNFRQKSGNTGENIIGMFPSISNQLMSPKNGEGKRNILSPKHGVSKSLAFDNNGKDLQSFENKIKFMEIK